MRQTLSIDQVPRGLIDELKAAYTVVDYQLDSDIQEDTKTFKARFVETDTNLVEGVVSDSKTFAPMQAEGHMQTFYIVRGDELNGVFTVRRVLSSTILDPVNILGPLMPGN